MLDERQLVVGLRLGNLDALLDVANRLEILGELRAVATAGSAPCRCATSSLTESSTLRCWRSRASRTLGSVLPLSPNSRSNTTRGLFCVGSGVFWLFQLIVLVYGHAKPVSQAPVVSLDSIASSSDASCVCLPVSCARI